ncbi:MAG: endonuclease [Flavobacteriales bacterium]|nr:MAG: endonuclease [Flavobacteriales bacterium]
MKYYVYVLRSDKFERNYTGFTTNLANRLKEHNSGKTISTRPYKPWKILYSECFSTKKEALDREKYLKSGIGREFIKKNMAL